MISTLLRQCMHDLDAALEQAIEEFGHEDRRTVLIGDACDWLRNWLRHYGAALRLPEQGP